MASAVWPDTHVGVVTEMNEIATMTHMDEKNNRNIFGIITLGYHHDRG